MSLVGRNASSESNRKSLISAMGNRIDLKASASPVDRQLIRTVFQHKLKGASSLILNTERDSLRTQSNPVCRPCCIKRMGIASHHVISHDVRRCTGRSIDDTLSPFSGRLSHESTVKDGVPWALRCRRAATIIPMADLGLARSPSKSLLTKTLFCTGHDMWYNCGVTVVLEKLLDSYSRGREAQS